MQFQFVQLMRQVNGSCAAKAGRRLSFAVVLTTSLWLFTSAVAVQAQDQDNSAANIAFAEALLLHKDFGTLEGTERVARARDILRILDLIVQAYPSSLPAQRITQGQPLGAIDVNVLRGIAGDTPAADPAPKPETQDAAVEAVVEDGETKTAATPEPEAAGPAPVTEENWFERVVPGGSTDGAFEHAAFPSNGQRTHPGVDIHAPCGAEVQAAKDGEVVAVVKAGDPAYADIGNAVIIRHTTVDETEVFSAYFHLDKTPVVALGKVTSGTILGGAGKTGAADACGVHFEIRHFESETFFHPLWHSTLALGDWSKDETFLTGWSDPAAWIKSEMFADRLRSGGFDVLMSPVATVGGLTLYPETLLSELPVRKRARVFQNSDKKHGGFQIELKREQDGFEVDVSVFSLEGRDGKDLTKADKLIVRLDASRKCSACEPLFSSKRTTTYGRLAKRPTGSGESVSFSIPIELAVLSETLGVTILRDTGEEILAATDAYELGSFEELADRDALSKEDAVSILRRVQQCTGWGSNQQFTLRVLLGFGRDGGVYSSLTHLIYADGIKAVPAENKLRSLVKKLQACEGDLFKVLPSHLSGPRQIEIEFGQEVKADRKAASE
ncbi:M23 family metallopeptidase [Alisedimentitalea sp. MJ-SS2]|uniref:M23 family metallopeptidase n=1 Tax=Aliisedimentitalea sp. MJ-SS2 TaxID=3049795 RepID=UPI00290CB774|nr:M23 family metallopeptidase [Alisedimentitalea sp. MJ-SS2]MDU8927693.1 M23 family metallopeptidase [Alisedimentitalea sp. MJ-SS2]